MIGPSNPDLFTKLIIIPVGTNRRSSGSPGFFTTTGEPDERGSSLRVTKNVCDKKRMGQKNVHFFNSRVSW